MLEQHIQDHCKSADDVKEAARRADKWHHSMFAVKHDPSTPNPSSIAPIAIYEAPDQEPLLSRDWLHVATTGREDQYPADFIRHIKRNVAREFEIEVIEIDSERRKKDAVIPRHVAMYLTRNLTPKSFPEIGRRFGGRDHTSIIHAINMTARRMVKDKDIGGIVRRWGGPYPEGFTRFGRDPRVEQH